MKPSLLCLFALSVLACAEDRFDVAACAAACKDNYSKMVRWSRAEGCVCDTPPPQSQDDKVCQ